MGTLKLPFVEHVGMRIEAQVEGRSRCTLVVEDFHRNSTGRVHGGVAFTLADTGMGAALYSTLEPGEQCATIEIKINYFKPVLGGRIVCISEVVNKGRRVANMESSVYVDDVLVAKANGSFAIFRPVKEDVD
ncbi:PaaI family thioesterase [Polaromonas sp.]|uniref:PaaI family thioesterase n=1 Tax=Polaromonas sp. TaxID=1869339 RepID=UPI003264C9A9